MPIANDLNAASLILSACLCAVSLLLGLAEWYTRRGRGGELSEADLDHFWRQDRRRSVGIGILLLLALLLPLGSRLNPGPNAEENLSFFVAWILVLVLLVVLLFLAVIDWMATRAYAARHRKQILRESIEATRRSVHAANRPATRDSDGPAGSAPSRQS
jgi:hypothetical protein